MLEAAPSFSIYSNTGEDEDKGENEVVNLVKSMKNGDQIDGSSDFSFVKTSLDLIKEEGDVNEEKIDGLEKLSNEEVPPVSPPMYLATGFGVGNDYEGIDFKVDRENSDEYGELLQEYPNHPTVLRNYAKFLMNKGDTEGAKYYYLRAVQTDPSDGEAMAEYAKLVWELHHDREKALTYFELATQTAPADSNVLAAYAKFLWEIDNDGQENLDHSDNVQPQDAQSIVHSDSLPAEGIQVISENQHGGNTCSTSEAVGPNENEDTEEYYRRMTKENPFDPRFLKAYAQYLYQSKENFKHAEDYYTRAMVADPQNGELLSQYANLVWELYRDQDKALYYFERAIQAAPGDSNVLAAYARFLWEVDDDDQKNPVLFDNAQAQHTPYIVYSDSLPSDGGNTCSPSRAAGPKKNEDIETYHKRMTKENPSDPQCLKAYAQFLYQSKGNLQFAEDYYLRAILADPQDGESLSQYANVVWELHHDQDKALNYFERAIQAAPGDSNVLAAYARFMWTIDDDDVLDEQLDFLPQRVLTTCAGA